VVYTATKGAVEAITRRLAGLKLCGAGRIRSTPSAPAWSRPRALRDFLLSFRPHSDHRPPCSPRPRWTAAAIRHMAAVAVFLASMTASGFTAIG